MKTVKFVTEYSPEQIEKDPTLINGVEGGAATRIVASEKSEKHTTDSATTWKRKWYQVEISNTPVNSYGETLYEGKYIAL